jgi:hypothetical protein
MMDNKEDRRIGRLRISEYASKEFIAIRRQDFITNEDILASLSPWLNDESVNKAGES